MELQWFNMMHLIDSFKLYQKAPTVQWLLKNTDPSSTNSPLFNEIMLVLISESGYQLSRGGASLSTDMYCTVGDFSLFDGSRKCEMQEQFLLSVLLFKRAMIDYASPQFR